MGEGGEGWEELEREGRQLGDAIQGYLDVLDLEPASSWISAEANAREESTKLCNNLAQDPETSRYPFTATPHEVLEQEISAMVVGDNAAGYPWRLGGWTSFL